MLNVVRFELMTDVVRQRVSVGIWVDGENLIDIIHRLETPWWAANGMAQPEGQYVWMPAISASAPVR